MIFICSGFIVGSTDSSVLPNTVKENAEKTYSNSSTKEETIKDDTNSEITPTDSDPTIILNRNKSNQNSKYLAKLVVLFPNHLLACYFLFSLQLGNR